MLRAAALAAAILVASTYTLPEQETECSDVGCEFTLTEAERLAGNSPVSDSDDNANDVTTEDLTDPCPWIVVDTAGPNSSWWEGNDPSAGHIELNKCALSDGTGPGVGVPQTRFVPNALPDTVNAPPPDPAVLARQAVAQLVVPKPTIGVGPDRTKLAVRLWTWLWVEDAPPVSVTVTLSGVSVTATATLTSTIWSLGEPASTDNGYRPGAPVKVTCTGAGTPPPSGYDWKAEPPCGHMYKWRSLKERTDGTGKWPITATTNWNINWQSNTGLSGTDSLTTTNADALDIGEYRIVLVQGPGG